MGTSDKSPPGRASLKSRWLSLAILAVLAAGSCRVGDGAPSAELKSTDPIRRVSIVSYDAGETLGLLPVADRLAEARIQVDWLPLTPWSRDLLKGEGVHHAALPEAIEVMPHLEDRRLESTVEPWIARLHDTGPDLVILGMVSEAQRQIAVASREARLPVVGFYDSFDPPAPDSIALILARAVDEIWAPSAAVFDALESRGFENVWLSGQPSVEAWYRLAQEVEPAHIRAIQKIPEQSSYALFAGQYGDGYEAVFRSFVDQFTKLLADNPKLMLVISHHPRTAGSLERTVVDELAESRIMMAVAGLSTAELATSAAVVATWRSTVGIQAAFIGKPVIYYGLESDGSYSNELIESGAAQLTTPRTIRTAVSEALESTGTLEASRRRLSQFGYVVDSDQRIADRVVAMLTR